MAFATSKLRQHPEILRANSKKKSIIDDKNASNSNNKIFATKAININHITILARKAKIYFKSETVLVNLPRLSAMWIIFR